MKTLKKYWWVILLIAIIAAVLLTKNPVSESLFPPPKPGDPDFTGRIQIPLPKTPTQATYTGRLVDGNPLTS